MEKFCLTGRCTWRPKMRAAFGGTHFVPQVNFTLAGKIMFRFSDNGRYNDEFQNNIAVICQKCSNQAVIIANGSRWTAKQSKVICSCCGFNETRNSALWYGPVIGRARRRCYQCGRWLEKTIKGPKHAYECKLQCPGCKCEMIEKITWHRTVNIEAHDPFFGLRLWFIGNVKGHEFWAYNREHLSFIYHLVIAKVRIREPNKNGSLVSRLPSWLLSGKNRLAVKKEINKMLRVIS